MKHKPVICIAQSPKAPVKKHVKRSFTLIELLVPIAQHYCKKLKQSLETLQRNNQQKKYSR